MKFNLTHRTVYQYEETVGFGTHRLYLRPRENHHVILDQFELNFTPQATIRWSRDAFENSIALAEFPLKSDRFEITATMTVELLESNPFNFVLDQAAVQLPFAYRPNDLFALQPYLNLSLSPSALGVREWLRTAIPNPPSDTVTFLSLLNSLIREYFFYQRRDEPGTQSADETLRKKSGTCRDLALLFVEICRDLGLASRFVSGYLYDPPVNGLYENRAAGSMHAWAEVFLPGPGWKGFDPTNGILTSDNFIPVAVAREPESINPIQGVYLTDHSVPNSLTTEVIIEPA